MISSAPASPPVVSYANDDVGFIISMLSSSMFYYVAVVLYLGGKSTVLQCNSRILEITLRKTNIIRYAHLL